MEKNLICETSFITLGIDFIKLCVIFGVLSHPVVMTLNNYIDFIQKVINQFGSRIGSNDYECYEFRVIKYGLALGCILSRSLCKVSNEGILCGSHLVDVEATENFILKAIPNLRKENKKDEVNFDKIISDFRSPNLS